jgi:Holliday junction DNA helicase RuvA
MPKNAVSALVNVGASLKLHTYLAVREDSLDLYGFPDAKSLELFERLISVSGIGPKSALAILGIAPVDQLAAAINEGRTELLTRVSGIGKKTAERVVLELKGKLSLTSSPQMLELMESDAELEETLSSLGFSRAQAKAAVSRVPKEITDFKARLKEALKNSK